MSVRGVIVCLAVTCLAISALAAPPSWNSGHDKYALGNKLLAQGDFEGAYQAFKTASQIQPYLDKYRLKTKVVRHIIKMRAALEQTRDNTLWFEYAQSLHTFYHNNGIHSEALALALKAQARQASPESLAMLTRTRLALGQNTDAADALRNLSGEWTTGEIHALMGIALARQGQIDTARKLLGNIQMPRNPGNQFLFDMARLYALVGNQKDTYRTLVQCFKKSPPSELESLKTRAQQSADFAKLRNTAGFAQALATESRTPEPSYHNKAYWYRTGRWQHRGNESRNQPTRP